MKLSKSEEELMNHLWKLKKALMKDLISAYQDPKPAATTVATLLKRMQVKEFIDYKQVGRSREYFPLIDKKDYFSNHVNGLIKSFFNDSASQFASFFTKETNLSKSELEALKAAEPESDYLSKSELENKIREKRKLMEGAAKALDFIIAAKLRDEIKNYQNKLEKLKV